MSKFTQSSIRRHCPLCGRKILGKKTADGITTFTCNVCKVVMTQLRKSRRHLIFELFTQHNETEDKSDIPA